MSKIDKQPVSQILEELVLQLGHSYTQEQAAVILGTTKTTLRDWLKGATPARNTVKIKLSLIGHAIKAGLSYEQFALRYKPLAEAWSLPSCSKEDWNDAPEHVEALSKEEASSRAEAINGHRHTPSSAAGIEENSLPEPTMLNKPTERSGSIKGLLPALALLALLALVIILSSRNYLWQDLTATPTPALSGWLDDFDFAVVPTPLLSPWEPSNLLLEKDDKQNTGISGKLPLGHSTPEYAYRPIESLESGYVYTLSFDAWPYADAHNCGVYLGAQDRHHDDPLSPCKHDLLVGWTIERNDGWRFDWRTPGQPPTPDINKSELISPVYKEIAAHLTIVVDTFNRTVSGSCSIDGITKAATTKPFLWDRVGGIVVFQDWSGGHNGCNFDNFRWVPQQRQ